MGWNFQLYRADSPLPPMQWADNLAAPIGTSEAVAAGLGEMLPIEWRPPPMRSKARPGLSVPISFSCSLPSGCVNSCSRLNSLPIFS